MSRLLKTTLLGAVVFLGGFQAGRLAERASFPCRIRPVARLVAPLLGQQMPNKELCELIKIPSF